MFKLAYLAVAAAALSAIPGAANAQSSVTCESSRGRRETCRVDTRGEVRLVQQLSDTRCIRGRNWGTVPGGVWVDDGCRARFASYGASNNGRWGNNGNNGRNGNDNWNRGRNGNDRWDRNDDRNRVIGGSWAMGQCRSAVQRRVGGNRHLNFWMEDSGRDRARVGWRADRGASGSCTVDRNGRVDVRVDRRR
jgi:hypothetical protein